MKNIDRNQSLSHKKVKFLLWLISIIVIAATLIIYINGYSSAGYFPIEDLTVKHGRCYIRVIGKDQSIKMACPRDIRDDDLVADKDLAYFMRFSSNLLFPGVGCLKSIDINDVIDNRP